MSYVQREIDVTVQLGSGTFGTTTYDTVTLTGLRVSATIVKAGGLAMNAADTRVYGVPLPIMNQLSTLGLKYQAQRNNRVTISAGNVGQAKAIVYTGTITDAWVDFGSQPQVAFHISSASLGFDKVRPSAPNSFPNGGDVTVMLASLASQAGYDFVNNGVSGVSLGPSYFPGTLPEQIEACATHAGIQYVFDDAAAGSHKLIIWPAGGSRDGSLPLISKDNGMMGYPTFNSQAIAVQCEFNPAISFGSIVQVQSSITPANGQWQVIGLTHDLESMTPGGRWMSSISCAAPGSPSMHS